MAHLGYCSQCGHELPEPEDPPERLLRQECPACGAQHYQNAKPCVGALIVRDGRVLLGRRAIEPFLDWWDIPGGFLEPWEHPVEGVAREVVEETGLQVSPTELLGIFVDRYGGHYTLNIYYIAEIVGGRAHPADDLVELGWFEPEALPERVAFANGREALSLWQRRALAGRVSSAEAPEGPRTDPPSE